MQSYNIWVGDTRKDCINHCVKWSHYFIRTFPYLRPFIQSCRLILVLYLHIHHIRITFFTSCYLIFKIQKTTPSPYFHRDTLRTASLWTSTTAFYNRLTGHYSWLAKEKEKKKKPLNCFFFFLSYMISGLSPLWCKFLLTSLLSILSENHCW